MAKQKKGGEKKRGGKEGRGMHDSPADQRRRERVAREQAESGKSPSAQRPKFRQQQRRSNGRDEIPAILLDPLAKVNVPAADIPPIRAELDQVLANPHVGLFDVGGGVVLEFLTDHRSNMAVRFVELPQDHTCYKVWSMSPDTFLLVHFLGWDHFVSKVPVEKVAKSQNAIWESLGPAYRKATRCRNESSAAKSQSIFAEALAPVREVLERAKYSSNATKFIHGEPGEYAFPKSGSVFLHMTDRRKIVLLGVEEGNPLFGILKGHEHKCEFTIDHLTGKTALPKDVRKDKDPLHIAIRRLCTNLREFLKPYGLMVFEQQKKAETPVRDPSRAITLDEFKAGDVGRLSFEGVSLRAVDGQGNTGKPRVEVSVVEVDGQHPDYEFLQGLVGKRMFISSYVVKLGPDYPRDKLKWKSESELDSLEALFLLLRRAFGHQAEFMRDKKLSNNSKAAAEEAVEAIVLPPTTTEDVPVGATVH